MTHLLAPLRYDRPLADVRRAVHPLMRGLRTGAFTEARLLAPALALDGYRTVHHPGKMGRAECALLVHEDDFIADLGPIQLSDVPIPRRGGWHNYAVGANTARGRILAVHMPSGVEGKSGFSSRYPGQVKAYRAQMGALRQYVARHDVAEIWADWNLNLKLDWVRDYFERVQFPGFEIVAPPTGTYKHRVIDFGLVRKGSGGSWTANATTNPASDHNAVVATHTPAPPKEAPVTYRHLPKNLPAILREAGLTVAVHPGWHGRGRPASTGEFKPVGVLCHHTATKPSSSDRAVVDLLIRGRSDLPGPLCQIGLDRSGTVHLIASGRANHAGRAKASGTVAAGDGNALYIGIEAFNDGVGEPWPAAQYQAFVRLAAVLSVKVTGNSVGTVRAHKETSVTGKIDPRFDMGEFRVRVQAEMDRLRQPAPRPAAPPTRVERARALLEKAKAVAPGDRRKKRIQSGLDQLPPK